MIELIEKKKRKAKVTGIISLVFLAILVIGMTFGATCESEAFLIIGILFGTYGFVITGIIYLVNNLFIRNLKWLTRLGKEHTIEDIDLTTPYIKSAKLYLGSEALYSKKDHIMIPYSEVAWVYSYVMTNRYVPIPTYYTVIHTKDRKKFMLYCSVDKMKDVIEGRFIPNNSNLVLGFGKNQKKRYKELNPK